MAYEIANNGSTSETTTYTYDRLNRMASATEDNVQTVYSYDASGNRSSTATYVGGALTTQTTYTYNLANLATSLTNKNSADSHSGRNPEECTSGYSLAVLATIAYKSQFEF